MKNFFPDEGIMNNFENYTINVKVDEKSYNLQLFDADSQEDKKNARQLIYPQADIFIVCFSLVSPQSLENVETIWLPEINQICQNKPFILSGVKSVLRDKYPERVEEFEKNGWVPVPTEKGEAMKTKVGALDYVECGPKNGFNVKEVIESAIKALKSSKEEAEENQNEGHCCHIC